MIFSNILRLCTLKDISALELLQTERCNGQTDETVIVLPALFLILRGTSHIVLLST